MFKKTSEGIKKLELWRFQLYLKNLDLSQTLMIYFLLLEELVMCNEASFTNAHKYQGGI